MTWFFLTIASYIILAIVNLGDKIVVDKLLKSSKAYAFSVAVLGCVLFILAPWHLEWPGLFLLILNLLIGASFIFALWLMYESLKQKEPSRVVVVIGGVVPIFTIIFSILFFQKTFSLSQWLGFLFLIAGIFIISFISSKKKKWPTFLNGIKLFFYSQNKSKWLVLAIFSALFYSIFFVGSKYVYSYQEFWSSFLWMRLGGLLPVLIFLLNKADREEIFNSFKIKQKSKIKINKFFVLVNQGLGAIASLIQNYAVYLGPVAIINALQGVQYAFLIILGIFFSIFFPKILKEDISFPVLTKKFLAITFVAIGLYFITI